MLNILVQRTYILYTVIIYTVQSVHGLTTEIDWVLFIYVQFALHTCCYIFPPPFLIPVRTSTYNKISNSTVQYMFYIDFIF